MVTEPACVGSGSQGVAAVYILWTHRVSPSMCMLSYLEESDIDPSDRIDVRGIAPRGHERGTLDGINLFEII